MKAGNLVKFSYSNASWFGLVLELKPEEDVMVIWRFGRHMTLPLSGFWDVEVIQ